MVKELGAEHIRFWVDNNVLHCKVFDSFFEKNTAKDLEHAFSRAICILSEGCYMPLLINIKSLDFLSTIKVFKFLCTNSELKASALAKAFLVNSLLLKIVLTLIAFKKEPVDPDFVFCSQSSAIKHCSRLNRIFNGASLNNDYGKLY